MSSCRGQQRCAHASMTLWAMRTKAAPLHWSTEQFEHLLLNTRKRAAHLFPEDHAHACSSARDVIRHPFAHGWEIRLGKVKSRVAHEVAGVHRLLHLTDSAICLCFCLVLCPLFWDNAPRMPKAFLGTLPRNSSSWQDGEQSCETCMRQ